MRMAGDVNVNQMMAELKEQQQLMAALQEKSRRKMNRQTNRDIAAVYGETIPFEPWEFS